MMNKQNKTISRTRPVYSTSFVAQGRGPQLLIWPRKNPQVPIRIFSNGYASAISVISLSFDESVVVAGTTTGEVLAWQVATGDSLLANRYSSSIALMREVSLSPPGDYLAAVNTAHMVQVWAMKSRCCIAVLPCCAQSQLQWSLDGSDLYIDDRIRWSDAL